MNAEEIANWSDGVWSLNHSGVGPTMTHKERLWLARTALDNVPVGGTIMEVGVYAGTSLSVFLQVARIKKARVLACDPFLYNGAEAELHLRHVLCQFPDVDWRFYPVNSRTAREYCHHVTLDYLHIDGDHFDVDNDCKLWLPLLRSGGIVAFHDVIPDPRSNIYQVCLDSMKHVGEWPLIHWANDENRQMIRRKP